MKAWMALLLVTAAALSAFATVEAHSCNGTNCGSCVKGEDHAHNGPSGQCTSGIYGEASNGPGGQQAPGSGTFWTLVAFVGAAGMLVVARRG